MNCRVLFPFIRHKTWGFKKSFLENFKTNLANLFNPNCQQLFPRGWKTGHPLIYPDEKNGHSFRNKADNLRQRTHDLEIKSSFSKIFGVFLDCFWFWDWHLFFRQEVPNLDEIIIWWQYLQRIEYHSYITMNFSWMIDVCINRVSL